MTPKELNQKMKIAIFDMDGTVVNSLGYFKKFWKFVGEKYFNTDNYTPDVEIDKRIRTMTIRDSAFYMCDALKLTEDPEVFYASCMNLLEDFYKNDVELKPGAAEYIKYISGSGRRIAIASATEKRLVEVALKKCGIFDSFDAVVSCEEVGYGKVRPDVFFAALERLSGTLDEAVVFEDSYVALETAKSAGFMTVGIFDAGNYNQERLKAASDLYLSEGESFNDLIV